MEIPSGYKTITPIQFGNVLWLIKTRQASFLDLRVYLACFVLVAVREAAGRSRCQRGETPKKLNHFRLGELERLTNLDRRHVQRALKRLASTSLLTFSEGEIVIAKEPLPGAEELIERLGCRRSPHRPVPVPRSLLRFLARNPLNALTQVVIAYLLRGLSIARSTGDICARGTVKASWIAETFGLSLRSVKYAQKALRERHWIGQDRQSHQRKLNRDGAYFEINLVWTIQSQEQQSMAKFDNSPTNTQCESPIVKLDKPVSPVAPLVSAICTAIAPPIQNQETSKRRSENQETRASEPVGAGVCSGSDGSKPTLDPPRLASIQTADLWNFNRLEELYFEAVQRNWINASEAMALNFIAAAVRAREVGCHPVRLFVSLVRRELWPHITQAQEEHARRALVHFREADPDRFRPKHRTNAMHHSRGKAA